MTSWRRIVLFLAASAVAGCVAATVLSTIHWGYAIHRPPFSIGPSDVASIESISPVEYAVAERVCRTPRNHAVPVAALVDHARRDPTTGHQGHLLGALQNAGLSPETAGTDPSLDVTDLINSLAEQGRIVRGDPGYDAELRLYGSALVLRDRGAHRHLLLALNSSAISNDHYASYEFLYSDVSDVWAIASSQHYFYDVAGIDGFDWPHLQGAGAILFMLLGMMTLLVATLARSGWHLVRGVAAQK